MGEMSSLFQPRPVSDDEFLLFQRLVLQESGIFLPLSKKALLTGRLTKRLRALGIPTFAGYYNYLHRGTDPEELVRMVDCICTNETHFFREPSHFDFLQKMVFPQWKREASEGKRRKKIRVWSAGCSTGEEPYSLAMVLKDAFDPLGGWDLSIWATDLSTKALDQAAKGLWPLKRAEEIPSKYLETYMLKGFRSMDGLMAAGDDLRSFIQFERFNLAECQFEGEGFFDIIFCRNVLIYFDRDLRKRVLQGLVRRLSREGYLCVGHAESLHEITGIKRLLPSICSPLEEGT